MEVIMKGKRTGILLLCFLSMILPSVTFSRFSEITIDNLKLNFLREFDLSNNQNDDGYTIRHGSIESKAIYDEKGNLSKITAFDNNTAKRLVDTSLTYDYDNRLTNIKTLSQTIAFNRRQNYIEKVSLNGGVIFETSKENNSIIQKYVNGTEMETTIIEPNSYKVKCGNQGTFVVNINEDLMPNEVIDAKTNKTTKFTYDDNGCLIGSKNSFGSICVNDGNADCYLFGTSVIVNCVGNTLSIIHNGNEKYSLEKRFNETDNSYVFSINRHDISTIFTDDSITGFNKYSDILGNNEFYAFNEFGYLISIDNGIQSNKEYRYDDFGKLIYSFTNNCSNYYSYDSSGNLLWEKVDGARVSYEYSNADNLNQLTAIDGSKLEYDGCGNLIKYSNCEYQWDCGQLLTKTLINGTTIEYKYANDKTRVAKNVNGATTNYAYFNGNLMATNCKNGSVNYFYNDENKPIGFFYKNSIYFYIKDAFGIIRGIVDENLFPVVIYDYDDWGIPSIKNCLSKSVADANSFLYKDYVYDFETGLYYLRSRYYSPILRRFISQDGLVKIAEFGSRDSNYNLYSYCNNNLIMLSDRYGYEAITLTFSALLITFACVAAIISVAFLTSKIVDEVANCFKNYKYDIKAYLENTRNRFKAIFTAFKKEAILAFGEYTLTLWMWWVDNGKLERHHIIARTSLKCADSRNVFTNTYGYSINDEANLVWLKYRFHKHLHTDSYYSAVNSYLLAGHNIGGKYLFLAHLAEIKGALIFTNGSLIF